MTDTFRLNAAEQRDQIIFDEGYNPGRYGGGIRDFDYLSLEQINELSKLDLLNLDDRQNNSPSMGEMINFLRTRETDGWYAHGYCVSPDRDDFRITFEGVGKHTPPSKQDIVDFTEMFRWADELIVNADRLWCWYD